MRTPTVWHDDAGQTCAIEREAVDDGLHVLNNTDTRAMHTA